MALIPKEAFTALADTQKSMAQIVELLIEIRDELKDRPLVPVDTLHGKKRAAQ